MRLPDRETTPIPSDYRPDINTTAELYAKNINIFQELIGEMRWDTEIGGVDILHAVSVLSEFQSSPPEGNLHNVFHIFGFMKNNPKLTIYFDPIFPNIYPTSLSGSSAE